MKLLFIYYDKINYLGGPIVNARRVLPELRKRGHEIHCVLFMMGEGESPSAKYLEEQGIFCYVKTLGIATEEKIDWILKLVAKISPDVFVPNLSVAGWFAARWIRDAGIPTIACHRSDDRFHWTMVDDFVCGNQEWSVSGLVCVSENFKKIIAEKNPEFTKLCVIPSGVPVPIESSLQTGPFKIAYVGRLVQEQKRIHDLVDALAIVINNNDGITATLFGDGPELETIQQHIENLELKHRINVFGVCPSEKIQDQLLQYHVLVLLSDYEGTPGAVMDAMACGVVPVCLDIPGGVQELVLNGVTGFLVKDRQQDFQRAIEKLSMNVNLRKQLAANARKHILERFSLDMAADHWEAFCQQLIDEAGERKTLQIPRNIQLPAVRSAFAREDFRRTENTLSLWSKVVRSIGLN